MTEWLSEKASTARTAPAAEPLEIQTTTEDEDEAAADFVRCVPSPHTSSMSHLRRNSTPITAITQDAMGSAKKVMAIALGCLMEL